ncbi:MAG: biotin--[acetyl-CoA-carboxylase] ligase, partial [Rhodobiaceae bacterium]|mgnify:FL=1|jgi:BirA family transcriptional regulator, biotin operon repressor / biotin---[acetyl-CoA-carboxylase] ligase|nr:biotin--[acetyl-CoA-carboxylase] ligase [Rhodobiaceae bacterium]MBT5640903.1 biotin--[acetyl-CoA-carboxylase] ligase [Rhodobiaceae bacterium]MBT6223546.1 biotin--[acetyl-CoA-carboxylase] ligase [Rhodobiaceae bacterium]
MIIDINKSNIKKYHTVNSTNNVAFDQIKSTNLTLDWIIAEVQTEGKGRHGRSWDSPSGGLYMTKILYADINYELMSNLGFVASLALYSTVDAYVLNSFSRNSIKLKWPNDVIINQLKLAGILIESQIINSKKIIVIGFGLNVFNEDIFRLGIKKAYLSDYTKTLKLDDLYISLINSFNNWFCKWDYGNNFNYILESWLSKTYSIGENIQVKTSDEIICGNFIGLNNDGSLVVEQNNIKRIVNSGEIILKNEK